MAVSFSDLEAAFDFVNFGGDGENEAVLDRRTGKIYCRSFFSGETDEGFPDEASEDSDEKYVAIPGRRDLDLGKTLVLDFARQVMSEGDYDEVRPLQSFARAQAASRQLARILGQGREGRVARLGRRKWRRAHILRNP
jgi:hypothetical protein